MDHIRLFDEDEIHIAQGPLHVGGHSPPTTL